MEYIFEYNNEEIQLPSYNLDVVDKLEKADKVNMSENRTLREKTKVLFELESDLIGEEKAKELVGGDLKSCDPNIVQILFIRIIRAYDKPIDDINAEQTQGTFEQLEQMKEVAEQMNKVPDTVGKVNRMKK